LRECDKVDAIDKVLDGVISMSAAGSDWKGQRLTALGAREPLPPPQAAIAEAAAADAPSQSASADDKIPASEEEMSSCSEA
jgi:hypothetical protein